MESGHNHKGKSEPVHVVRLSIGVKIFSIACGLVLLMAGTAAFSTWYVDRISDELEALTSAYLPLERHLAEIDVAVLEQELALERTRHLYMSGSPDPALLEAATGSFSRYGSIIDSEVEAARALLARTLDGDISDRAKKDLSRFDVRLEYVEKEHQDFEDHARELAALVQKGQQGGAETGWQEKVEALNNRLLAEEEEFDKSVDVLRRKVDDFVLFVAVQTQEDEERLLWLILAVTLVSAILGLGLAALVTAGMVRPVRRLMRAVHRVEKGRLDTQVEVSTRDEIGRLAHGFNEMVGELRVKERIKDTFGKYVDPRIVGDLIDQPEMSRPGGDRRVMTVLFSDIRDFTSISERLSPGDLVTMLNEYLSQMSRPIRDEKGVIDKYIGDAIMAYWGPPFVPREEQAVRACRAALGKLAALESVGARLPEILGIRSGAPDIDIRIGIATGPMIVGTVGSDLSMNYTVLGDTVNLGSRLEGACKVYGIRTLIDDRTRDLAGDAIVVREIDWLRVKGKDAPERVFELVGLAEAAGDTELERVRLFEAGLAAYRDKDWDRAGKAFESCRAVENGGGPSLVFLRRVAFFRDEPPPDPWDGVWRMHGK